MVPRGAEIADALIAEKVSQASNGCERGHDQGRPEKPERGRAPGRIARAPEDQVTDERRHEKSDRERDQHRMERVSGDLGRALWVKRSHFLPPDSHVISW